MKSRILAYWIPTVLLSLAMLVGGVFDLLRPPAVLEGLQHLGYPPVLATVLGVWKLLGVAALLAPGLPRVKEWAYAGFFFDLSGALASHVAAGDAVSEFAPIFVLMALLVASWAFRPGSRLLGEVLRSAPADAGASLATARG